MADKKIPMRMCVGCRQMHPKRQLVRIVRTPEGEVKLDLTGKASGRGAYLCNNAECLLKAQRIRALDRALDIKVGEEVFSRLKTSMGVETDGH